MGKKKRNGNLSVFAMVEGNREQAFIEFLVIIYQPKLNKIAFSPTKAKDRGNANGGGADSIISPVLKACDRDRAFAWLDEDFEPDKSPLSAEVRKQLAKCWNITDDSEKKEFMKCHLGELQARFNSENKKKPMLIVSKPVCCESLILAILGVDLPYDNYEPNQRKKQIDTLKDKLEKVMGGEKTIKEQTAYYLQNLTKEKLEEKRQSIPELDLLISMITK